MSTPCRDMTCCASERNLFVLGLDPGETVLACPQTAEQMAPPECSGVVQSDESQSAETLLQNIPHGPLTEIQCHPSAEPDMLMFSGPSSLWPAPSSYLTHPPSTQTHYFVRLIDSAHLRRHNLSFIQLVVKLRSCPLLP